MKNERLLTTIIGVLALLLACSGLASTRQAAAQQGETTIYLAFVNGAAGQSTPPPPPPASEEGAVWLPYALPDGSVLPTYGASAAVDSDGGIHVVYAIYSGVDHLGQNPAIYTHCAANCSDSDSWNFTRLGDEVQEARLALTPSGKPRVLLYGPVDDPTWPRMRYQYAACDANCSAPASWTISTIATPIEPTATREYNNNRYFAVDRQGRAAFLYTDTLQNNHPGTFYMSCAANCSDPNQWVETMLSEALFDKMSLAFSPDGQPRLAFGFSDEHDDLYLAFAWCDSGCTEGVNWLGNILTQVHGSAKYSLVVEDHGLPRLALYSGTYSYDPLQAGQLYYLWCQSGCEAPENWSFSAVGQDIGSGDGVSLVLDHQDRPRLSFETAGQGLGYAWCENGCESGSGDWQFRDVEPQAALAENYEVLPVQRCTVSTWFNGQRSSLALDPDGNPRVAYDAQHWWYGTELINGVPRACNYQDVTVTRLALFEQP